MGEEWEGCLWALDNLTDFFEGKVGIIFAVVGVEVIGYALRPAG